MFSTGNTDHLFGDQVRSQIRGPGVALGLVTPFARAARTVLRGASRGFAAVLVARLRRGVGYAASPLTSK